MQVKFLCLLVLLLFTQPVNLLSESCFALPCFQAVLSRTLLLKLQSPVYRCENYRLTAIIASLLIGRPYVSALQVYRTAINQGLSGHVNCYLILLMLFSLCLQ
jgi:hypothetical protein